MQTPNRIVVLHLYYVLQRACVRACVGARAGLCAYVREVYNRFYVVGRGRLVVRHYTGDAYAIANCRLSTGPLSSRVASRPRGQGLH